MYQKLFISSLGILVKVRKIKPVILYMHFRRYNLFLSLLAYGISFLNLSAGMVLRVLSDRTLRRKSLKVRYCLIRFFLTLVNKIIDYRRSRYILKIKGVNKNFFLMVDLIMEKNRKIDYLYFAGHSIYYRQKLKKARRIKRKIKKKILPND